MPEARILVYSKYREDLPRFERALSTSLTGVSVDYAGSYAEAKTSLSHAEILYGWGFPVGMLTEMPRLRWVQKMGAGVDDLVGEWPTGSGVVLTRTDGQLIAPRMIEYVLCAILRRTLKLSFAETLRKEKRWDYFEIGSIRQHRIGEAGLGEIGTEIAKALRQLGAEVIGWRRTRSQVASVNRLYAGRSSLEAFVSQCSILVLVLPLTYGTRRLFGAEVFASFKTGMHLINIGRGAVIDEQALIEALDSGRVDHATLDVFDREPLPENHPFWGDERVTITPHICGPLIPEDIVPHFVENYRAYRQGQPLKNVVDIERQY